MGKGLHAQSCFVSLGSHQLSKQLRRKAKLKNRCGWKNLMFVSVSAATNSPCAHRSRLLPQNQDPRAAPRVGPGPGQAGGSTATPTGAFACERSSFIENELNHSFRQFCSLRISFHGAEESESHALGSRAEPHSRCSWGLTYNN